jgi:hypothetical protein
MSLSLQDERACVLKKAHRYSTVTLADAQESKQKYFIKPQRGIWLPQHRSVRERERRK